MGTIRKHLIKRVQVECIRFLKSGRSIDESTFLFRIVIFCELLGTVYNVSNENDTSVLFTSDIIKDQSKNAIFKDLYDFRNLICHQFGSNRYNKLRKKMPSYSAFDTLVSKTIKEIEDTANRQLERIDTF